MERLPNINFNEEKLYTYINNGLISCGSEGLIFFYGLNNVIKIFKSSNNNHNIYEMSENKFNKILTLYYKNLEYLVKVLSTVTLNGHLIGYTMPYLRFYSPISKHKLCNRELLEKLTKLRKIIEYLNSHNIIYGDIHDDNILYNHITNKIYLCDIDNMTIDNYPYDKIGSSLSNYIKEHGRLDKTLDAYAYNLFAIYMALFNDEFITRLQLLNILKENHEIFINNFCQMLPNQNKEKIRSIISKMLTPKEYHGEYII